MPIQRIGGPRPEPYPDLLNLLTAELEADVQAEGTAGDGPLVIEEMDLRGTSLHVTVIWDRWQNVPPEERGRVILDAYRNAGNRGEEVMRSIRLALGLTRDEATRIGVGSQAG